jgi:methylmalonyl-CoA mutase
MKICILSRMSNLDPQWDTFPAMDADTWWQLIHAELKGASAASLDWPIDTDLIGKPFYLDTPDMVSGPIIRKNDPPGWLILEWLPIGMAPWSTNAAGLEALEKGAQALVIPLSDPADIPILLDKVIMDLAPVYWDLQADVDPAACVEILHHYLDQQGTHVAYRGGFIGPIADDLLLEAQDRMPGWTAQLGSLPGVHAPATQLTGLLYTLFEKLKSLTKVNSVPPNGMVIVEIGNDYLLEIARLRALHLLWGHLASSFGWPADTSLTIMAKITPDATLPWETTYISAATRALSAILGGVDMLTILPPEVENQTMARRIARNVQHLMKEEAHLDKVADPMAGSYAIETLTLEIARKAWADFNP